MLLALSYKEMTSNFGKWGDGKSDSKIHDFLDMKNREYIRVKGRNTSNDSIPLLFERKIIAFAWKYHKLQ